MPSEAAHRFFRVLRLEDGATVEVFDGLGRVARGRLEAPGCMVDVVVSQAAKGLPHIVVVQGMTKTEKLELVVQKGTELGASAFWMLACARSQVHLDVDRAGKRRDRLRRVAEDAARQCGRAIVPDVQGPWTMGALVDEVRTFMGVAVVGVVDAPVPLTEALVAAEDRLIHHGLLVVVGPEGGLDDREVGQLVDAGAHSVRLGTHIMRTETAALAALAATQVVLGHL